MKATIWATAALVTITFTIAFAAIMFQESFPKGQAIIMTGSSLTITMIALSLVNIIREWSKN
jgi:uncharacterized membrane protein